MQNLYEKIRNARAFLIDMDGVLYDTMPFHTLAWQRMISEQGILCSRDEFYEYEGMTGIATINLIYRREKGISVSPEEAKRLYSIKSKYFSEYGQKPKMPGIDDLLSYMREKGRERVLVTGSGQSSILEKLSADFPGIFDEDKRVTALDVKHGKPDPEPYLIGAAKAGLDPSECLVLENAPLGVKAGHDAGCSVIAMNTGPISPARLKDAGANIVLDNPTQVLELLKKLWN